ncbi:HlyC/CorC family transporter [Tepidamorphus sp. 3E244]|uniref:HlyC/CorC family transporter n=1 Tax=Tepidamorphus sp. 3E244 TaxID=3385498 RepID=UPI0038FC3A54
MALTLTALAIVALLAMSAFFSGSETALTAASRARMHSMESRGNSQAAIVNKLISARERLIGALLLGNNLVNILASALATSMFLSLFGDAGVAIATLVMTALVLVFAEVLPKTYAINNSDRMALFVAPYLRRIVALFGPVAMAVEAIVGVLLRMLGANNYQEDDESNAHDEIRGAIDLHTLEGSVVREHRNMLGGVLDLNELEVSDVMIHRTNIEALNADETPARLVELALASSYSRLPLWRETTDNIVGVLHVKNLLRAIMAAGGSSDGIDVLGLASPPWFVPDTTTLHDQLSAFLKRKSHFAVVVDEYGEVMGLITLEDIIEEIVGDISDEHDVVVAGVKPQTDGSVKVDGNVPIRDLNRAMDWTLPDDEATTIAGLVIHEARLIPEPGQAFTFHGFRFAVTGREKNRITSLHVRRADLPGKRRSRL